MIDNLPISQEFLEFDKRLFETVKNINILSAVEPVNLQQQKKAFFASQFSTEPDFHSIDSDVDLFATKRELFSLPFKAVTDEVLHTIYFESINSCVDNKRQNEDEKSNKNRMK
jgi:hypothetical protein